MSPTQRELDRGNPAYDKPKNYDEMVRAAEAAARAARAAGAPYESVVLSARTAAYQVAGLKPKDDPWVDRQDLA